MNNFWLKIIVLGAIILGLVIFVKFLSPSKSQQPSESQSSPVQQEADRTEPQPKPRQEPPKSVPPVVEPPAVQPPRQEPPKLVPPVVETPAEQPKPTAETDENIEKNIEAERLYNMAVFESKLARKPLFSYIKMVDYCRQILERFPDTEYAEKARALLRRIPEDQRVRYKITDKELGLETPPAP